ncbi:MAG: tRNA (adenosine(37)-N6)-dimethylallyltransferase MiaA [Sphingomonadales bacterium]|nr:tRNA (adenosine(37)-N6)-dimethylallyltransferase MiaA [Sphingomonadales bacterium]
MKNKAVFLAGPTAGGKSALALALAERANGVIINADSMQVYRELRIVTARPSAAEEARAPHRLYGYRAASDVSSAATWSADATAALAVAWAAGQLPIVVGGSGLYLRTLLYGIAPIPDVPPTVRQEVRSRMAEEGASALHRQLQELDPETASRLKAGDRQRIARALEVALATGEPLSAWQRRPLEGGILPEIDACCLVLAPPRDVLYARCDQRLEQMMAEGGLEEIRAFLAANPPPDVPLRRALAVPEFSRHLAGELGHEEALTLAQTATRQYAKRQMTWFRHQFSDWPSGDEQFLKRLLSEKFPFIRF